MRKYLLLSLLSIIALCGCNHDNDDSPCAHGHCPAPIPVPTVAVPVPAAGAIAATAVVHVPPVILNGDASPPVVTLQGGIKRAVIVGINKFLDPGAPPLTGCVPDAARAYAKATGDVVATRKIFGSAADTLKIEKWAVNSWGIDPVNITLLLDEQATVANVKAALNAAVAASKPGDSLLYWQSSHGTEDTIPDDNGAAVHGMVCCYDFGWDREHEFCDVDFKAIFSKLPDDVSFNWVSDSCNSGDLDRNVGKHKHPVRSKALPHPPNVRLRVHAARINEAKTKGLVNGILDVGFLPGCKPDQTSADSEDDDGCPGGALSIMLMKEFDNFSDKPISALAKQVDNDLASDGYDQVCVPSGARKNKPFLKP